MISSFADPSAEAFRLEVREWLGRTLPPDWRAHELSATEDEQVELRRDWDRKLHEAGYAGLSWPKRHGGRDAGPILETILHEELARAHAPEGLGRIGRVMAGPLIMLNGTDSQRARFLPHILDGSEIWCLGYSEPHAGSDLAAITTSATRDGDRYRIRGRKIWTSYAHLAHRCVLLTRSSTERPRYENITMFLLDMHQPGVLITPIITAAGDHHFNEVVFEDAIASQEERLGAEQDGWRVFRSSLRFERGSSVALNHYLEMRRESDVLRECCASRSDLPGATATAEALGDRVEIIRWHIMRSIELEASGVSARSVQVTLKLYWSELWQELVDFGARVSCNHHRDFWRYQHMQARAATIYGGTSEIQRNTIARLLLQKGGRVNA